METSDSQISPDFMEHKIPLRLSQEFAFYGVFYTKTFFFFVFLIHSVDDASARIFCVTFETFLIYANNIRRSWGAEM
jgi:hypothetical protein